MFLCVWYPCVCMCAEGAGTMHRGYNPFGFSWVRATRGPPHPMCLSHPPTQSLLLGTIISPDLPPYKGDRKSVV